MNYEKKFKQSMEKLSKTHERSKVYVDFMDYFIYQNSESHDRTLPSGYKPHEMELIHTAYTSFIELMKQLINKYGWYDYLGEYYEEYVLAGHKASSKGQFYTPRQIGELLSKIVGFDVGMNEAYDPACGSARNLLDYHSRHPEVCCTGDDLDESACKMAVINFSCHNVNGVVNWVDALTREYMGTSWKTINGQIYITDMDWIGAVDEVCEGVSLMQLGDDVWKQVAKMVSAEESTTEEMSYHFKTERDGANKLDEWLQ